MKKPDERASCIYMARVYLAQAKTQRKLDGRAFCALLLKACPAAEGKPTVVIEAVATMGGQNNAVQTQGSLLRTLGAAETVPECLG